MITKGSNIMKVDGKNGGIGMAEDEVKCLLASSLGNAARKHHKDAAMNGKVIGTVQYEAVDSYDLDNSDEDDKSLDCTPGVNFVNDLKHDVQDTPKAMETGNY